MEHLRSTNVVFAIVMTLLVGQSSARPQSDEFEEVKKSLYNVCSSKFPLTEEIKNNAKKMIFIEDPNFKCYLKCCLDEMSLIDEDGIIDGDSLIAMVMDKIRPATEKIVQNCLKTNKQDGCEASFQFFACSLKINSMIVEFLPL